jgi:hypothetical protein
MAVGPESSHQSRTGFASDSLRGVPEPSSRPGEFHQDGPVSGFPVAE